MRLIIAECSVIYTGRGDTKLPKAVRAIIIKGDGAVSVHHDASNKPLNYMGKGNIFTEGEDKDGCITWNFDTRKESLQITLGEILSDTDIPLDVLNSELERDNTEKQLQEWLAESPESLGKGWTLVGREHATGAGPVDLLMKDHRGHYVSVEVKRVALTNAVYQATRYSEALKELDEEYETVRPVIAALEIRPKAAEVAVKKGVEFLQVPKTWNPNNVTETDSQEHAEDDTIVEEESHDKENNETLRVR